MSEKRYFKVEYNEEWYLFDSNTISKELVTEQSEYGYGVFANSLSPSEIVDLLNEQQDIIKKQCNHKKAIFGFLKFMKMDNPLMEIMIDEFLEEVYDCDKNE